MAAANPILDCGANVGQTALSYNKTFSNGENLKFRTLRYALRASRTKYCGDWQFKPLRMGIYGERGESQFL
jgi:hypothetical protein